MAVKVYLRRFISLLLCCLLVFCSLPVRVHASDPVTAASLAITGGQLAGAGLSGEAALSLAGPVGAVVGVTLGALGVNAYVSQAAQEAGKTRTRFVLDKLVIWGAQAGYTQEQLYSKIAQGISVAADGTIQLGNDVAKTIQQFGNWLISTPGEVVESVTSDSGDNVTLGDYSFPVTPFSFDYQVINSSSSFTNCILSSSYSKQFAIAAYIDGTAYGYNYVNFVIVGPKNVFSRNETVPISFKTGNASPHTSNISFSTTSGNYVAGISRNGYVLAGSFSGIPVFNSYSELLEALSSASGWDVSSPPAYDEVFTGTPDAWAENKDVLNPSANDTPITLNPDLLNPIIDSLADGQQATMGIVDYLEALQDAWDHALDDVQTAIGTITDSLTGIQEQIAIPQTAVENPSITNPSVTPDTTPILNPSDVDPGTAITGLSFDLTNIFPFCIPFDIYAALNLLDAEPVAPSYHFHFDWPYNIVIDFTLDLSPFDQVAAVARTMETLIFIIGLAVMTRSMFIRG